MRSRLAVILMADVVEYKPEMVPGQAGAIGLIRERRRYVLRRNKHYREPSAWKILHSRM
ncbi:hypothetical protein [Ruegeria lacuscaerulensis]|uniref:hypothetical protein n=1 Tax=Ruegeria lacuscaerulensis TaxID=55218 RepID=UPI00147C656C|nr:hypothetical protein [Ruegeria lacuscaerulensis]